MLDLASYLSAPVYLQLIYHHRIVTSRRIPPAVLAALTLCTCMSLLLPLFCMGGGLAGMMILVQGTHYTESLVSLPMLVLVYWAIASSVLIVKAWLFDGISF